MESNFIRRNWILILLLISVFILGYFLRAYVPINHELPYSPYEAFSASVQDQNLLPKGEDKSFTDKTMRYPTSIIAGQMFNQFFGDFYIIYLLGFVAVFLLGVELTSNRYGGILALLLYAVSSENLLQYTRFTSNSGLCYVLILFSIYFLTRYLKTKKLHHLILYILASVLALTSYHTGATALIMIIIGICVSMLYSKRYDIMVLLSSFGLFIFYIVWLVLFDLHQIELISHALIIEPINLLALLMLASSVLMLVLLFQKQLIKFFSIRIFQSEYLPLLALIPASLLIFFNIPLQQIFTSVGTTNYYISNTTFNNYLAQIVLTHVYLITLFPIFIREKIRTNDIIKRGWLIGLIGIIVGLVAENFFSRIPDYSFLLMFILFATYWAYHKRFRKTVVIGTLILLVISQMMIFHDPFTQRRYYETEEIESARNIIELQLNGTFASDLRTAALFKYLNENDVKFSMAHENLHRKLFYNYKKTKFIEGNDAVDFVILTKAMESIVYATNFQTTPLKNDIYEYYSGNHSEIYDDGVMFVYKLNKTRTGKEKTSKMKVIA